MLVQTCEGLISFENFCNEAIPVLQGGLDCTACAWFVNSGVVCVEATVCVLPSWQAVLRLRLAVTRSSPPAGVLQLVRQSAAAPNACHTGRHLSRQSEHDNSGIGCRSSCKPELLCEWQATYSYFHHL